MMDHNERISKALHHPINILALSIAIAASSLTLSPYPFIIGVIAEVIYMILSVNNVPLIFSNNNNSIERNADSRPNKQARDFINVQSESTNDKINAVMGIVSSKSVEEEQFKKIEALLPDIISSYEFIKTTLTDLEDKFSELTDIALTLDSTPDIIEADNGRLLSANIDIPSITNSTDYTERLESIARFARAHIDRELSNIAFHQTNHNNDDAETNTRELILLGNTIDILKRYITNLYYQKQYIERSFDSLNSHIHMRTPKQLLADLNAVLIQSNAVIRTLNSLPVCAFSWEASSI